MKISINESGDLAIEPDTKDEAFELGEFYNQYCEQYDISFNGGSRVFIGIKPNDKKPVEQKKEGE